LILLVVGDRHGGFGDPVQVHEVTRLAQMSYRIKKVRPNEVDNLHEILRKCGEDLRIRFGLGHWDPPYPIHLLRRDAEERSVYAVLDGRQTVGTFTIGTEAYPYHDMSIWTAPTAKAAYVGHLAVLPDLQGNGIGTWCMRTIERFAVDEDSETIRLDVYRAHVKGLEFYARLGYSARGVVEFRDTEMICLEKVLTTERAQRNRSRRKV
jgi:GNAT superfamily N-acetyltransferase